MKLKYYLMSVASALMLSNCAQEETPQSLQGNVKALTATIEGSSRSAVTDGGVFSWTEGDAISVWNGESFTTFTRSNGNVFTSDEAITPSGVAIYPANDGHGYNNSTVTVNLATEYAYGSTNAPMVAEVGSTALTFKHVGGLMRFIVKGMPETADSFTFTANAGITGDFTVNEGVITAAEATESTKSVTIKFTQEQYNAESMTFYVPLPTGTYAGYTVTVGGNSHTTDAAVVNTIGRGTLLLMPTFTYTETELVKGEGNTVVMEAEEQSMNLSGNQELVVEMPEGGIQDGVEAVLNLNYTPSQDATLSLSDGSEENAESSKESAATVNVTVPEDATIASLNVAMPSMTVSLNAAEGKEVTYTKVTAFTAQNTLKIGKGVNVGKLIIKGGHIRLGGSITGEITRDEANDDAVTYIILEEGVEVPVKLPENVKVINAAEYDLIKAIADGNEVVLENDVEITTYLSISKNLTLDLNGKTLERKGTTGQRTIFYVTGSNQFTLTGEGTVKGTEVVWAAGTSVVNIEGGHYIMNTTDESFPLIYSKGGTINVKGGQFESVRTDNGSFAGTQYNLLNVKDNSGGSIVVTGGEFKNFNPANCYSEGDPTSFVATGYKVINKATGEDMTEAHDASQEGDIWYVVVADPTTLFQAAINEGGNLTLNENVEVTKYITVGTNATLNLNGKTLERKGTTGQRTIFFVTGSNQFTLTGEGTVKGTEVVWAAGTSVVNIEGGHYIMNTTDESFPLIYSKGGTINVKGGKFESVITDNGSFAGTQYNLLNVKDNSGGSIVVTGGEFKNFNPANCYSEGVPTSFVASGYKVVNKATGEKMSEAHDASKEGDIWYEVVKE